MPVPIGMALTRTYITSMNTEYTIHYYNIRQKHVQPALLHCVERNDTASYAGVGTSSATARAVRVRTSTRLMGLVGMVVSAEEKVSDQ